jgi:hypothetical protein
MAPATGLYARLLGDSWQQLAPAVRLAHTTGSSLSAHGQLHIDRGRNQVARTVAALMRLPRRNAAAETQLAVTSRGDSEHWHRTFDDRQLDTRQYQTGDGLLGERFGILDFRFRLTAVDGSLVFRQVDAAVVCGSLRLRLPAALAPTVEAREDPAGARGTAIHARVVLPLIGPVLTYDGTMHVEDNRP